MNQVAEKPRSDDQGPLPLIPPGKGDDMVPESSRRLKGKINTCTEDLSMGFFCFERPINEKEFNLAILSRGKEILDQSANIGIILFTDVSQQGAPFFKIHRPAIVRIHQAQVP